MLAWAPPAVATEILCTNLYYGDFNPGTKSGKLLFVKKTKVLPADKQFFVTKKDASENRVSCLESRLLLKSRFKNTNCLWWHRWLQLVHELVYTIPGQFHSNTYRELHTLAPILQFPRELVYQLCHGRCVDLIEYNWVNLKVVVELIQHSLPLKDSLSLSKEQHDNSFSSMMKRATKRMMDLAWSHCCLIALITVSLLELKHSTRRLKLPSFTRTVTMLI